MIDPQTRQRLGVGLYRAYGGQLSHIARDDGVTRTQWGARKIVALCGNSFVEGYAFSASWSDENLCQRCKKALEKMLTGDRQ